MDPTIDVRHMRETLMSRVDEQLAHTYEQIKSADEELARMENRLHTHAREEAPHSDIPQSRRRPWRGVVGLTAVACIVAAAVISQSSYGEVVAQWVPQLGPVLKLPKLAHLTQPDSSFVQLAAAGPASQIAPTSTALPASSEPAKPPDAKSLDTMARDLANLQREIEQLKASQQQLVSDNAKAIEQIRASQEQAGRDIASNAELLKANQEQVAQLMAKASQQNLRPRPPAPQPQAAVGTRKPVPTPASTTPASSHATAHLQAPTPLQPREQ